MNTLITVWFVSSFAAFIINNYELKQFYDPNDPKVWWKTSIIRYNFLTAMIVTIAYATNILVTKP